ncbi:MAG TPA: hypothetical protein DCM08_07260, partial [Microscillaceae bacterium]|nr:hypothetical protein [Microscillaceae bacterium]
MAATAQAQDKTTEFTTKVAELLKDYYNFYPTEKIHLTTDKQYYVAGDKIWLQAFVTYDNPVWTDSLSRVLYVELIDSQKQIVQTVLLYIQTNAAKGFLQLPADLSSDHYHLRAYTSWLRNIGEFAFARIPLIVINPDAPNLLEDEETRSALQLSFFTEGGQLVKNIPSKIAFSAVDGYGRPSVVKGFIQDVNGTKYGDFQTNEQGLGAFKIMPLSEAALQAIVPMPDGTQKVVELPKVKSEGLVLSATHLGKDSIRLQIQHNLNSLSDGSQNYFIIAQAQGKVYFIGASTLESKKITTFIPKRGMPEGILHLMILSEKGKLEAERLVYISKKSTLNIGLSNSATVYQPRESITLQIETSDPEDRKSTR